MRFASRLPAARCRVTATTKHVAVFQERFHALLHIDVHRAQKQNRSACDDSLRQNCCGGRSRRQLVASENGDASSPVAAPVSVAIATKNRRRCRHTAPRGRHCAAPSLRQPAQKRIAAKRTERRRNAERQRHHDAGDHQSPRLTCGKVKAEHEIALQRGDARLPSARAVRAARVSARPCVRSARRVGVRELRAACAV